MIHQAKEADIPHKLKDRDRLKSQETNGSGEEPDKVLESQRIKASLVLSMGNESKTN